MYTNHKQIDLENIEFSVYADGCARCENNNSQVDKILRSEAFAKFLKIGGLDF